MVGHIFPIFASEADVVVGGFAGSYSSLAQSGPAIPITVEPCFYPGVAIARHDTIAYGITLSIENSSWLYPSIGLYFAQQQVKGKYGDIKSEVGNTYSSECRMSLKASSTTTFLWTDLGVEMEIPRKSKNARSTWRSLITGAGGSLIYAKDRIHSGSKYIYHYERWGKEPVSFSEPILMDLRHEEKDLGGFYSSGFGLGWYFLLGLRFHLSRSFSLTLETRADFGTAKLNPGNGNTAKELRFHSGTVGIAGSYRL